MTGRLLIVRLFLAAAVSCVTACDEKCRGGPGYVGWSSDRVESTLSNERMSILVTVRQKSGSFADNAQKKLIFRLVKNSTTVYEASECLRAGRLDFEADWNSNEVVRLAILDGAGAEARTVATLVVRAVGDGGYSHTFDPGN